MSIKNKLILSTAIFIGVVMIQGLLTLFTVDLMSGMRAFIGAESTWAKGQKDSIHHLMLYVKHKDESSYEKYLQSVDIPIGWEIFRIESFQKAGLDIPARWEIYGAQESLYDEGFNREKWIDGLVRGKAHPDDINAMTRLITVFKDIDYVKRSLDVWIEGFDHIEETMVLAERLHKIISEGNPSEDEINRIMAKLNEINMDVLELEYAYSKLLGEASRWLQRILVTFVIIVSILGIVIGSFFFFTVMRSILKGVSQLKRHASRVAEGDLSQDVIIGTNDEIGLFGKSFNKMTAHLRKTMTSIENLTDAQNKLETSNQQLKANTQELRASEQQFKAANAELAEKMVEAEKLNKSMTGRELRIIEVKEEVNKLSEELGRPAPYALE